MNFNHKCDNSQKLETVVLGGVYYRFVWAMCWGLQATSQIMIVKAMLW